MAEKRMKNVLFVVPSLRRAGAETQVVHLVNGLDSGNIRKTLFAFEHELDQFDCIDRKHVKFHHWSRKTKYDFSIATYLAGLIDREEIDIVHCTMEFAMLIGWLAAVRSKRKPALIVSIHTTKNRSIKQELQERLLYQWLLRRCDRVVFVCRSQQQFWTGRYSFLEQNSVVIHNGVDTQYFRRGPFHQAGRELCRSLAVPDTGQVITCIAGFRPEKGHTFLLRAFAGLPGTSHLLLAGEGPARPAVEAQVASLGLGKRVHFLGNIADVRPVIAASDLTVLASTAVETFSMAMLESMSMEVPVVASDVGGLSEAIIPGETGALVDPGDSDSLGAMLGELLVDRDRLDEMGRRARDLVEREFSMEHMIHRMEELLLATG